MTRPALRPVALLCCLLVSSWSEAGAAGAAPDAEQLMAAQRLSLQPLAGLDGLWRGPAKVFQPGGEVLELTQTERVGSLLGGTVKLIEGRGYLADGSSPFNAFAVISYSPATRQYNLRSYAQGRSGDFPIELRPDGFSWTIPAGPARLRYTAVVKDGSWTEVGERLVEGQAPVKTYEMNLRRVGDSDWPMGGSVAPR